MRSITRPTGLLVTSLFLSLGFTNPALAPLRDADEGVSIPRRVAGAILDFLVPSARALTESNNNNFFGTGAGDDNTTGDSNSFFGAAAGADNTTGSFNSYFGWNAGSLSTAGISNSFFGAEAGHSNTGNANTFVGRAAGMSNTSGSDNTYFGRSAGILNSTGADNSFVGSNAGFANTTGGNNTFLGRSAGFNNTTGNSNAFVGRSSGLSNTSEHNNAFIGAFSNGAAGISNATALGNRALVEQSNAMVLGSIPGVNSGIDYVDVGIGTTMPQAPLHVERANGTARVQVTELQPGPSMPFQGVAQGLVRFELNDEASGERWRFTNAGSKFAINNVGADSPGTEMSVFKNGDLVIGGLLTENSDVNAKQDIVPVDRHEVLAKIAVLPIAEWSYKDAPAQRHIGPMAQDFHTAFGLGRDNKHIATLDTSGVALAGIKALVEENHRMAEESQGLRERLEDLESLVRGLLEYQ